MKGLLLSKTDGRVTKARGAIRKLMALGFEPSDVIKLIRWNQEVLLDRRRVRETDSKPGSEREGRLRMAQWTIRTMIALGFDETDIAEMVGVNHTTIAHALDPYDPRTLGETTIANLKKCVDNAGAERLNRLLPRLAIEVLDTCCDKGRALDNPTRASLVVALRTNLQNALVFASAPAPLVPGVHASLSRVGEAKHGLYLVNVPGAVSGTLEDQIAHMGRVEHELEHILQRYREDRKRLEKQRGHNRDLPNDGGIA